jgi:hypothetical protein
MNVKLVNAVVVFLMFIGFCGVASAEKCKDVTVKVTNNFLNAGIKHQIQVVDLDYWDPQDAKWREENGVPNVTINEDKTRKVDTRNLEYVGGQKGVIVRVQFKYFAASSNSWSEKINAESDKFTCSADGPNTVTIVVKGI